MPARQPVDRPCPGSSGIEFSDPFALAVDAMVINKSDTTPYKSFEELKGQPVGAMAGTVYIDGLSKRGLDVKEYKTAAELYQAIASGEVKVGNDSADTAGYILSKGGFPDVALSTTYVPAYSSSVHIGVLAGNPVLAQINASLAKLKDDGTLAALGKKWGVVPPN